MELILALFMALTPHSCPYLYEYAAPACDNGIRYDGYWWRGDWVPGYPAVETWMTPGPNWFYGAAVRYAPGVMEATARANQFSLDGYLGGVSIPNCGNLGDEVWLNPGMGWEGPYLVTDCTRLGDLWGVVYYRGVAVEVDYRTAERWGMGDRLERVEVSTSPEPDGERAARYSWWWLGILQLAPRWESLPLWIDGQWWAWMPYGE